MKISKGFMLRKVAGENVVVPLGKAISKLNGIIKLNDMGVFLWNQLKSDISEEELVAAVMKEYSGDEALIRKDIHAYIEHLSNIGCIE